MVDSQNARAPRISTVTSLLASASEFCLSAIRYPLLETDYLSVSCSNSMLMPSERISFTSTLKDSGMPAFIS
jgi:hypothetical protein